MSDYLKKELHTIDAQYIEQEDGSLLFQKQTITPVTPQLHHYYIVKLANYILHPYEGFTLHENFNNNIIPECEYMEIEVQEVMGKMYKINGVGYDYDEGIELREKRWCGYVPQKGITFLKEIF